MFVCKSCGAIFDESEALEEETEIPCPCGCGNYLVMLLCPYCGSADLSRWEGN